MKWSSLLCSSWHPIQRYSVLGGSEVLYGDVANNTSRVATSLPDSSCWLVDETCIKMDWHMFQYFLCQQQNQWEINGNPKGPPQFSGWDHPPILTTRDAGFKSQSLSLVWRSLSQGWKSPAHGGFHTWGIPKMDGLEFIIGKSHEIG